MKTFAAWLLCAWVLWEHESVFRPTGVDQAWTIMYTYDVGDKCRADVARLMHPNAGWRIGFKQLAEDSVTQEIGAVSRTKRVLCVPGSLDPRPRGK